MYDGDIIALCILFGPLLVSCCNSSNYHFRVRACWDDKRHKTTVSDYISVLWTRVECSTYLIPAAPRIPKRRAVSFLGFGTLRPPTHSPNSTRGSKRLKRLIFFDIGSRRWTNMLPFTYPQWIWWSILPHQNFEKASVGEEMIQ
jgi:hypothetical protein